MVDLLALPYDKARRAAVAHVTAVVAARTARDPIRIEPNRHVKWPPPVRPVCEMMRDVTELHYEEIRRGVRAICWSERRVEPAMVEDAIHTAALKLLRFNKTCDNLRALWVKAAINCLRDELKSPRVRRTDSWPSAENAESEHVERAIVQSVPTRVADTPFGRLARSEFREIVAQFLASHPPKTTEVLWRVDVEGQDHATVARALRLTPGATKQRLMRARDAFRDFLDAKYPDITTGDLFN
jgi:RNA polymerase sigma factor (sigma-70 family)